MVLATRNGTAPASQTGDAVFTNFYVDGLFDGVKIKLNDNADIEERRAEALAYVWTEIRRRAECGEGTDPALARCIYGRRLHAIERRLHTDGTRRRSDAYDIRAYLDGDVEFFRIGGIIEGKNEELDATLAEASRQLQAEPERTLNSALDLRTWLRDLTAEERALIKGRAAGDTLAELAAENRIDTSTVCRRLKQLGKELAVRAEVEVPESNRGRPKKE